MSAWIWKIDLVKLQCSLCKNRFDTLIIPPWFNDQKSFENYKDQVPLSTFFLKNRFPPIVCGMNPMILLKWHTSFLAPVIVHPALFPMFEKT